MGVTGCLSSYIIGEALRGSPATNGSDLLNVTVSCGVVFPTAGYSEVAPPFESGALFGWGSRATFPHDALVVYCPNAAPVLPRAPPRGTACQGCLCKLVM